MHPRVVRPEIPSPDEDHLAVGATLERRDEALLDVGDDRLRRELDRARRRSQHLGQARLQRTEVHAVRVGLEHREREPALVSGSTELVAVRTGAQHQIQHPLRSSAPVRRQRLDDLAGVATLDRCAAARHRLLHHREQREVVERECGLDAGPLAGHDRREPQHRLPLGDLVTHALDGRRRVVRDVADGERVQREVVVALGQRPRRREDHVGVLGGLVAVDVDRDHEVERHERAIQPARVGRGDDRVARDRDHRPDLSVTRCLDLVRQRRDRVLAEVLGQVLHPTPPATELHARGPCRRGVDVGPAEVAGVANIIPPSRSRFPASTLTTSTSQDASVPNSCVHVPMRP